MKHPKGVEEAQREMLESWLDSSRRCTEDLEMADQIRDLHHNGLVEFFVDQEGEVRMRATEKGMREADCITRKRIN